MEEFDKKYYKIRDVAEMLNISASTLRYWEMEFPECAPRRSQSNQRYYTPENIRTLQKINYLVKQKGLRIEAAKAELKANPENVSRRYDAIELLTETRNELKEMLAALSKRKG
jgi:DNA-binding transcriptional MerR regulator